MFSRNRKLWRLELEHYTIKSEFPTEPTPFWYECEEYTLKAKHPSLVLMLVFPVSPLSFASGGILYQQDHLSARIGGWCCAAPCCGARMPSVWQSNGSNISSYLYMHRCMCNNVEMRTEKSNLTAMFGSQICGEKAKGKRKGMKRKGSERKRIRYMTFIRVLFHTWTGHIKLNENHPESWRSVVPFQN